MSNDGLKSISLPMFADETLKPTHGHILQCAKAKILNQKEHHSDAWFFNHPEIVIVYGSQGLLHYKRDGITKGSTVCPILSHYIPSSVGSKPLIVFTQQLVFQHSSHLVDNKLLGN
jgi:hypothetical protein